MFHPSRLTLARIRRGLTKTDLAAHLRVAGKTVSAYETGDIVPPDSTVTDFSRILQFPAGFFSAGRVDILEACGASFRSLSSMSARQRAATLGAGTIAICFAEWIEQRFHLPRASLPDMRGHKPEAASEAVRYEWGIGERPIKNVIHLLESKGVRVFSLAQECHTVDAFSVWRNDTPYVFLNTMKSGERSRFDAAHELAHLLLHRHGAPQGRETEREADSFASAFLMSRGSVLAAAPRLPSIDLLIQLKRNWNVSLASLVRRLHDLNLLDDWHYRGLCVEMARLGYRTSEPNGIRRESSQLLQKVFQALRERGMSFGTIARSQHLPPNELSSLVFGLAIVPVAGCAVENARPANTGELRLV